MIVSLRPLVMGLLTAIVVSGPVLTFQLWVWRNVPVLWEGSFARSCAPHHAISNSAWLFVATFALVSGGLLLRDLRLALMGRTASR